MPYHYNGQYQRLVVLLHIVSNVMQAGGFGIMFAPGRLPPLEFLLVLLMFQRWQTIMMPKEKDGTQQTLTSKEPPLKTKMNKLGQLAPFSVQQEVQFYDVTNKCCKPQHSRMSYRAFSTTGLPTVKSEIISLGILFGIAAA
jgi:hypothetical protein